MSKYRIIEHSDYNHCAKKLATRFSVQKQLTFLWWKYWSTMTEEKFYHDYGSSNVTMYFATKSKAQKHLNRLADNTQLKYHNYDCS